jgi:hypothetical protein
MKTFAWMALVAACVAIPAAAEAQEQYGAVAYSPGGAYGWSNNYPTLREARSKANENCLSYSNGESCSIVGTARNQCLAFADTRDADGVYGFSAGSDLETVLKNALAICNDKSGGGGSNCGVIVWSC